MSEHPRPRRRSQAATVSDDTAKYTKGEAPHYVEDDLSETQVYRPIYDRPAEAAEVPTRRRRSQAIRLQEDVDEVEETRVVAAPPPRPTRQAPSALTYEYEDEPDEEYEEPPQPKRPAPAYARPASSRPVSAAKRTHYPDDDEEDDDQDAYYDEDEEVYGAKHFQPNRGKGCLIAIIAAIVLLAVALTVIWVGLPDLRDQLLSYITPTATIMPTATPVPTAEPTPAPTFVPMTDIPNASVLNVLANPQTQPDPQQPMSFIVTTTKDTQRVRLVDNNGQELMQKDTEYIDADAGRTWVLSYTFAAPYAGSIEVHPGNATDWNEENSQTVNVQVGDAAAPVVANNTTNTVVDLATAAPEPTAEPEPTPEPTASPNPFRLQDASSVDTTKPSALNITSDVIVDGTVQEAYSRSKALSLGAPEEYNSVRGITTFRGDSFRQNAAYGTVNPSEFKLEVAWTSTIGQLDNYKGVGWTGQPAIILWPKDIREMMNINSDKMTKTALKEIIYPTMDGKIYFYDLEDGKPTREAINVGYPLKGSVTVHPRGIPFMTTGQGVSILKAGKGPIGVRMFNLLNQKEVFMLNGVDKNAYLTSGAFDGSGLIDPATDTYITGGENGLLYTVDLNLNFNYNAQTLSIDPKATTYRYKAGSTDQNIETSVAVYGKYAYFASEGGVLQCVDMNTMSPVWAQNVSDNTDATPALEVEADGRVALYTGCSVLAQKANGDAHIRRINALTGEIEWDYAVKCLYSTQAMGGVVSSPVVGKNHLDGLVFFTVAKTSDGGTLFALDKQTGEVAWQKPMKAFSWSSPVAVYSDLGIGWIIQADAEGNLVMYNGLTGDEVASVKLGDRIDASPAVFGDMLVVGSSEGKKVYGVKIK